MSTIRSSRTSNAIKNFRNNIGVFLGFTIDMFHCWRALPSSYELIIPLDPRRDALQPPPEMAPIVAWEMGLPSATPSDTPLSEKLETLVLPC